MARGEGNRMVAVTRYLPKGNIPGEMKANVTPPLQVNPFELNTFSKTREEANLDVQTALIAPEICQGVAKRLNRQLHGDLPKMKIKNKMRFLGSKPPLLIPNGTVFLPLMTMTCCGPPSILDVNAAPMKARQNFEILSPLNLNSGNSNHSQSRGINDSSMLNNKEGGLSSSSIFNSDPQKVKYQNSNIFPSKVNDKQNSLLRSGNYATPTKPEFSFLAPS